MTTINYSKARENLAAIWDEIENSREEVILRREATRTLQCFRPTNCGR